MPIMRFSWPLVWVLGVVILLLIGARLSWEHARRDERLRIRVKGDNMMGITGLRMWVSSAAATEPVQFENAVGTGLVARATSLPAAILDEMPSGEQTEELRDTFGRPFHVKLWRCASNSPAGTTRYVLFIWSDGPNGKDEGGKGDDISEGESVVDCASY